LKKSNIHKSFKYNAKTVPAYDKNFAVALAIPNHFSKTMVQKNFQYIVASIVIEIINAQIIKT
jgi:hypothetical protein